jgi:hypothetical protein
MNKKRQEITYILRIWQEPSGLTPPGEWRGTLRSLDGRPERLFKSAEELWDLLIHSPVPPQPAIETVKILPKNTIDEKKGEINMRKLSKLLLAGSLAMLLLLCVGVSGWLFLQNRTQGARSVVLIQSPTSGALTEVNQTLPLMVYAEANRPILRLEVYADGALAAAANGNEKALTLAQPWAVTTPGRHVLLARAFFSAEDFADSSVVFVDTADLSGLPVQVNVDDLPRGEGVTEIRVGDLAAAAGIPPAELARLNPGLPAAPEAVIPPGTPLSLPRRSNPPPAPGAIPPVPPPAPGGPGSPAPGGAPGGAPPPAPGAPGSPAPSPASPHFDGETHSCSQVSLRWTSGEFETGYRIYRLAPGEDAMTLLANVPVSVNTYTDSPITRIGTYRYFLSPVWRNGGAGITSMVEIVIGPECSPAGTGATTSLNLLMLDLTTQEAYDGVYCYVSVNGSRYERLPDDPDVLLRPTRGELGYELPLQLPNRGQYALTVPSDGLVRLDGECWGRRGVQSLRIGRFSGSHARSEWDGRDLTSEVRAFEPRELASAAGLPAGAGGASFLRYRIQPAGSRFDLSLYNGVIQLPPAILEPIHDDSPTIPAPTNLRVRNWANCDVFPTTGDDNAVSVCDSAPLEPTLFWDWSANSFYSEADLTAWLIRVTVVSDELRPDAQPTTAVNLIVRRQPGTTRMTRSTRMPALPSYYACGARVSVTVTAMTTRGDSLPSQPIFVDQPPCANLGRVRITVNSVVVGRVTADEGVRDDGDICILCVDRRLEVFGDIYIGVRKIVPISIDRPSHDVGTILTGGCPHGTACATEGEQHWWFEMEAPAQSLGNQGEITFVVLWSDYDTENAPDHYCVASGSLAPRNQSEWTRINDTVILRGGSSEASCRVEILVQGIP